jgi:hypothetical protein
MLNDEQKLKVSAWIADGVKLSDIQSRLGEEYGLRLTYMEVRLLVDDLKLTPKDPVEPPKPEAPPAPELSAPEGEPSPIAETMAELQPAGGGKVTLVADTIARPGTVVSGSVTFSDGKKAAWYLDQTGRLGVVPEEQGYRPPSADVQEFQLLLDQRLAKMGF